MPVLSKELFDIQANIEYRFILKRAHYMTKTYSQMHGIDKYSQFNSIISWIWPNDWVFVDELSGCGLGSRSTHLNFRYPYFFEKGVPWHSDKYRLQLTLKGVPGKRKTYSQMHGINKYSQFNSIITSVFAKWLSIRWRTKWLWVRNHFHWIKLQISCLFWVKNSFTFRQT